MGSARILVLGGGRQGRVVAGALAPHFPVTVADRIPVEVAGTAHVVSDLSDPNEVEHLAARYDLVIGALPAGIGFDAARATVAARRSFVDIAFYEQDATVLDADARRAGVVVLPDCGLAPGLSNLVCGRAVAVKDRRAIHVKVGGVAADARRPYGYVITWSPDDLCSEYVRPARIRRGGQVVTLPATSELELVDIPGLGQMEAFLTDGLRTLLALDVPEMTEKTLRWPGHVAAVRPYLADGSLRARLARDCTEGDDLVAFRIDVDGEAPVFMVDRAQHGLTAMARTTALTCAAFGRLVAEGRVAATGLATPELIGRDRDAYRALLDMLAGYGITFSPRYPFAA
jgi:lysine 6-dehydrogenase